MFEIIPNWHPIFVHFTIALLSLSVLLYAVIPLVKPQLQNEWQTVARWALWFGALVTVITGLSGLYAYNTVNHDTPSHLAMTDHRNWAAVTIVSFLALASWSVFWTRKKKILGISFIVCMVIAGALLASTAWRGGEVVFRHGLGVMSLPKSEGDGHHHSHGDGDAHGHGADSNLNDHHDMMDNMDFSDMDEMMDDMMEDEDDDHDHGHDHDHG